MMRARANSLFHFTPSLENLLSILGGAFEPRYCHEDIQWQGWPATPFAAYPMVCFCDIPLTRIAAHVAAYGSFGLGMSKEWGIRSGLNPLLYLSDGSLLKQRLVEFYATAGRLGQPGTEEYGRETQRGFLNSVGTLFSFCKPMVGATARNPGVLQEFYQESEWRYAPQHPGLMFPITDLVLTPDLLSSMTQLAKDHCSLKFLPEDIRHILVPSEADVATVVQSIEGMFAARASSERSILMSRVLSIERLNEDIA